MRENPQKFRLGKEFYNEDEITHNHAQFVRSLNTAYSKMEQYANYQELARQLLDRIRSVYGKGAFNIAEELYTKWLLEKKERDGF